MLGSSIRSGYFPKTTRNKYQWRTRCSRRPIRRVYNSRRDSSRRFVGVCKSSLLVCGECPRERVQGQFRVEYLYNRDTVASVGLLMSKTLPFTTTNTTIKTFRHALSLDEVCTLSHSCLHPVPSIYSPHALLTCSVARNSVPTSITASHQTQPEQSKTSPPRWG